MKIPPGCPECILRPLKSIIKWTSGLIGPDFAFQVTTMVIPAVTVAPVESVADIHTRCDPVSETRPPILPVAVSKVAPDGSRPNKRYVTAGGCRPVTIGWMTGRRSSAAPALTDASPTIDTEKAAGGSTDSDQCAKSDLSPHVKAGEIVSAWAGTATASPRRSTVARIILHPNQDCGSQSHRHRQDD